MSFFYLVHKEDADTYDAREQELRPLRDRLNDFGPLDQERERYSREEAILKPLFDKVHARHKPPRVVQPLFEGNPPDLHNYFVYYRGIRWGNASPNDKALTMQQKGLDRMVDSHKKSSS